MSFHFSSLILASLISTCSVYSVAVRDFIFVSLHATDPNKFHLSHQFNKPPRLSGLLRITSETSFSSLFRLKFQEKLSGADFRQVILALASLDALTSILGDLSRLSKSSSAHLFLVVTILHSSIYKNISYRSITITISWSSRRPSPVVVCCVVSATFIMLLVVCARLAGWEGRVNGVQILFWPLDSRARPVLLAIYANTRLCLGL